MGNGGLGLASDASSDLEGESSSKFLPREEAGRLDTRRQTDKLLNSRLART